VYFIDRLTYRLRLDPTNFDLRAELAEALLSVDRVFEAEEVIAATPFEVRDARYDALFARIESLRREVALRRIAELERVLAASPGDLNAQRDLGAEYVFAGRSADAIALLDRYLAQRPGDLDSRYRYALALQQVQAYDAALAEAQRLLSAEPQNYDYQRLYALSALALGRSDAQAERYVRALLDRNPRDIGLLLDLATFALRDGDLDLAERYWTQAYSTRNPIFQERLETLWADIQDRRLGGPQRFDPILNEARALFADSLYDQSVQTYARYFAEAGAADRAGSLNRGLLIEYAQALSAGRFYSDAIAVFERVQDERYELEVAREIARNQYARGDYAGTILTLEEAQQIARQNGMMLTYPSRLLLADAYREAGQYRDADRLYRALLLEDPNDRVVAERIILLEGWSTFTVRESNSRNSFAAVVAPTLEATVADGSGTRFERWAPGTLAQITIPAPVIISAGIMSHYMSGTRRLVPQAERVSARVNEVFVGGWVDLTPPSDEALDNPLTNRISGSVGVHDYEGRRSVPFYQARYWHHTPGVFNASVGFHSTEGSIELWSPAGGEFELRLDQVDVRASTSAILPDSLVRVAVSVALNRVRDTYALGGLSTSPNPQRTNFGLVAQVDGSIRLLPRWWTGVSFYNTRYEFGTDLYFSPANFRTYDLWLEHLQRRGGAFYWRTRGSVGLVGASGGAISTRIETELTWRLANRLSWVFSGSMSRSARRFGESTIDPDTGIDFQRYDIFTLSTQLYWTLI
jgi:thioredoxin-like negative regulator of GroEL